MWTHSIVIAGSLLTLLVACTTVVDGGCTEFQPITYSASQDSETTKAQIRGHNAAWVKLCSK